MFRLRGLLLLAALFTAPAARAAEINSRDLGDGVHLITIIGDIKAGDEDRFRALTLRHEKAIVSLASDGGALTPALEIGRLINLRGYFTVVLDGFACSSACALIWTAGARRFLHSGGRVGFHASYYESGGRRIEGGIGNALVGRYLTQLGMSERTIVFATMASPESITWLTSANKDRAGITFESLSDTNVSPPPLIRTETRLQSSARSGWQEVTSHGSVRYYMDPARMGSAGPYRTAWEKADRSKDETVSHYTEVNMHHYDCSARRMALKKYVEYDREGRISAQGEFTASEMRWFNVVPDSVGEAKLEFVCGQ